MDENSHLSAAPLPLLQRETSAPGSTPTSTLGKSKFCQNLLITLYDPAASLTRQLPSSAFFTSLLYLSKQHHEAALILFTTGAFSLPTALWLHSSLLVLPPWPPSLFAICFSKPSPNSSWHCQAHAFTSLQGFEAAPPRRFGVQLTHLHSTSKP